MCGEGGLVWTWANGSNLLTECTDGFEGGVQRTCAVHIIIRDPPQVTSVLVAEGEWNTGFLKPSQMLPPAPCHLGNMEATPLL